MSNKQKIDNSKNILILSPFFSPNIGGVETHLDDLCTYLSDNNWKVHVLTYRPLTTNTKWKKQEKINNIIIKRINWPAGKWFNKFEGNALLQFLYLVPRLFLATFFYLIKNPQVKIIHSHGLSATFIGKILKPFFHFKLFYSSHAVYEMYNSSLIRKFMFFILKSCNHIFALSEPSKKELIELGIIQEKISIYRHWVDQNKFKPLLKNEKQKLREKYNIPLNKTTILFIGRLIEKKGIDIILQLTRLFKEVTFIIAGDGPMESQVKDAEKELENLIFPGFISSDQTMELYQISDIQLVPSKYEEGFGRVIIEGMSAGLQIIASNMGAIPIVLDGTPAIIVSPAIDNFKDALQSQLKHAGNLPDISTQMRSIAIQKYSSDNGRIFTKEYLS